MKKIVIILLLSYNVPAFSQQPLFIWPLKVMDNYSYSGINDYYIINNFVDSNNNMTIQDWNCGNRTYPAHTGIDIDPWPFTWSMMDNNYVAVVAAAAGRVAEVSDNNNNENNCLQSGENTQANYITIRHVDSSTSVYVHIRDNSAQVVVGQIVAAGDIIAYVGSSGQSSHPHLHFEVHSTPVGGYGSQTNLIDPYAGPCNTINANSWWLNQKPYREPAVLRIMTHSATPQLIGGVSSGTCRINELKNPKAAFAPNDPIYFGIAIRDFLQGQFFTVTVFNPNGTTWFSESYSNLSVTQSRKYNTVAKQIPGNAAAGTYKMEVSFNGTTTTHFFTVNCPSSQIVTGSVSGFQGYKASGTITSTASIGNSNKLFLQAGTRITLSPGFSATNGSSLKARIRECDYSE